MTLWTDIAEWRGPVLHHTGTIADHMYVVIHTADGTYEGTISWQKNKASGNSSHFVVDYDGKIAQVNDTANRSGAQKDGNPYSIAIENAGNENKPLTAYQIEANARILAKAHLVHGVPLQITGKVGTRGLGHHSMGAESGQNWGHSACPGVIIKAQKPAILARAIEIVTTGDTDMDATQAKQLADVAYTLTAGDLGPEHVRWAKGMAKLDAILAKLGVAQSDIDDIQARVGGITLTDAQVQLFAQELNLTPDVITAAARKAIDARLDDDATT
jgi:hypothetical protein